MVKGKITTALPLSEMQLSAFAERFAKKLGQEVSLKQAVDKTLIGGVVVEIDGRIYDASIKSQLAAILRTLQSGRMDAL